MCARRIGPQMQYATTIVARNPGCSKKFVAEIISPLNDPRKNAQVDQNWKLGYDPVNRAIAAGLIRAEKLPSGTYRLFASETA